jgi:hypothetical protein
VSKFWTFVEVFFWGGLDPGSFPGTLDWLKGGSNHMNHGRAVFGVLAAGMVVNAPVFAEIYRESEEMQIQVIYGEDNRKDLYQETDPLLLRLADSTVALMRKADLRTKGEVTRLETQNYGEDYNLCKDEPYYLQSTAAFCSGSLVGEDLILTAGHCVSESRCESVAFTFGFAVTDAAQPVVDQVRTQDVYFCKAVLAREVEGEGPDYALIKLDRKVVDHEPLPVRRTGHLAVGTDIAVIGHPAGLPTKIATGAKVRRIEKSGFFVANLDTYGGNSGSAVFNATTGLIEGILVRGEDDFRWRSGTGESCKESNRCTDEGCRGEDVTVIDKVAHLIPEI